MPFAGQISSFLCFNIFSIANGKRRESVKKKEKKTDTETRDVPYANIFLGSPPAFECQPAFRSSIY